MAYDIQAATEAGHSIDDQLAHLAKLHNYDTQAAQEAGHSKEDQLNYLASLDEPGQSIGDKISGVLGVDDTISAPAVGTALGAVTGSALGSQVGGATDTALEYLAKKIAPAAVSEAELGAPKGVTSWLKQETGHPYAGGKTKEEAFLKSEIARGKPVKSRGSEMPIRKGRLGITNQLEVQEPTLAKKAATNIIEGERLGKPGMARRMLGMGVAGGELGNVKEELEKGNYGRAALSGLGALGGVASQSKIKPIRAIGTALSAGVPALQYFLPDTEEDVSNINKKAGGSVQNFQVGGTVLKKAAPQVAEGAKKYSDIIQNYIGKVLHPTIVDTTKVDLPLGKMGGPEASNLQNISPLHKAEDWVFANDSMAAAKRLHNVSQRNDGNAIITGLLGSPYQLKTNRSVFGDLTDEFYKAIAAGKLDPELLQKYQDAMKASTYKTNKGMMTTFPEQFDIRDRAALEENAKLFHQRAALADIMGGKGPTGVQLGGKKGQIFNWEDVLGAARDPNTIGAPTQSIGTRLFTLNERAPEYRPDLHNAFDYALFGKDLGHSFAPVPKEVGYPDAIEAIRQSNIAKGKKPDVTSMHLSRNILTQPITEDYVKAVQASGFKKGGKAKKKK